MYLGMHAGSFIIAQSDILNYFYLVGSSYLKQLQAKHGPEIITILFPLSTKKHRIIILSHNSLSCLVILLVLGFLYGLL